MAPATLPQISRQTVGQALRQFRLAFAHSSRELNAVNRAALNLEACRWQFAGDVLVIESATDTGHTRYHVDSTGCECHAAAHGKPCWHMAAHRLLSYAATAPLRPTKTFAELQAAADELYA